MEKMVEKYECCYNLYNTNRSWVYETESFKKGTMPTCFWKEAVNLDIAVFLLVQSKSVKIEIWHKEYT